MRRPPFFRLVVVAGGLSMLAVACAGGDDPPAVRPASPPDTSTAPPTTAPPDTTPTTLAPDLEAVQIALEPVASGLRSPVAIAWRAGDERPYVVEQGGRIVVVDGGAPVEPPVLEIAVATGGNEQGLLGLAFSPGGERLYVNYTDPRGDTHVDEYTMRAGVAEPASRRELLFVDQPYSNHNGGQVTVGPDGMLYVGLGDGGSGGDPQGHGQNPGTLLGTILRIDPEGDPYAIPPDNPFVGRDGARPEVWMYGLRNPWRFSFDRATGDVWVADVGQDLWEEVNLARAGDAAGANWEWSRREGSHEFAGDPPPGGRGPILDLAQADGYCSVIGGHVYRGEAIPALRGAYVFSDFCRGVLEALAEEGGTVVARRDLSSVVPDMTSFGERPDGELYVLSRRGEVFRIVSG